MCPNVAEQSGDFLESFSAFEEGGLWEQNLKSLVEHEAYPILFRSDGYMYPLNSHADLLDINLRDNDLLVVGPHGEITPFAVLAFRQKFFETLGSSFFQFDAHHDSCDSKCPSFAATVLFEFLLGKKVNFSSHLARQDIGRFLSDLPDSEARKAFLDLCKTMRRDVETFIASMRGLFERIVPCIRPEGAAEPVKHRPVSPDAYLADGLETDKTSRACMSPSEFVSSSRSRFNFYSVDGDFAGVRREKKPDSVFENAMEQLLEAMSASAEVRNGQKSLYGVSLDKRYVADPVRFILQFLRKFYFPEIVGKTA